LDLCRIWNLFPGRKLHTIEDFLQGSRYFSRPLIAGEGWQLARIDAVEYPPGKFTMLATVPVDRPRFLNQVMQLVASFDETPQRVSRAGRVRRLELTRWLGHHDVSANADTDGNYQQTRASLQSGHHAETDSLGS
jgi:hypothetical protein